MATIWPFRHLGLKIVSLGLAIVLWMAVAGELTVERGLRVPLELQQFPPGLEINGEPPSTVDVRVRGTSGALSRVSPGDIVAVLDLRAAREGQRLFNMVPEQVRAPFGVEVVQIAPSTLTFEFEKSATRQVPVKPSIDGQPAAGYVVSKVTIDPPQVDVVGSQTAIARATEALTEPVSVEGRTESLTEKVTVGMADPAVRLKTQRTATITVNIVRGSVERTLRGRPVHLLNLRQDLVAEAVPATVSIGLRGGREAMDRLDVDTVRLYVDLAGLGPGQYTLTVHADAPRDVGVTRIEPASVQVKVTSGQP
jgi:YbbR domain-containing protein